jgi:hypothetical protein
MIESINSMYNAGSKSNGPFHDVLPWKGISIAIKVYSFPKKGSK